MIPLTLGDRIPEDHQVRLPAEILDSLDWSSWERHYVLVAGQPPIHPKIIAGALIYQSTGRLDEAAPPALEALDLFLATKGENDPNTLTVMSTVAWLLTSQEKFAQAEALHRRALEGKMRVLGPDHPDTVSGMHGLAECLRVQGRFTEAAGILEQAETAAHRAWPADSWMISAVQAMYGDTLVHLERYDDAESMLIAAIERLEPVVGADHQLTQTAIGSLIEVYNKTGRPELASKWVEKKRNAAGKD